MSKLANLYIGRAGQMAVMAEFLIRGYNVAVPEVDVGDDILVVRDSDGEFARVQVKATNATSTNRGYSARYTLKLSQLALPIRPEIWYVFASRFQDKWDTFVIIPREKLFELYELYNIGSVNKNGVVSLYFANHDGNIICSGQDLTRFAGNWSDWPTIEH